MVVHDILHHIYNLVHGELQLLHCKCQRVPEDSMLLVCKRIH